MKHQIKVCYSKDNASSNKGHVGTIGKIFLHIYLNAKLEVLKLILHRKPIKKIIKMQHNDVYDKLKNINAIKTLVYFC